MDRFAGCYVNLDSWNSNHLVVDFVDRVAGCYVNLGSWNSNHLVVDFEDRVAGCFVNLRSSNLNHVAGCYVNLGSWNSNHLVADFVDRVAGCFANRDSWSLGSRAVAGLVLRSPEGFAVRWESPVGHHLARRKGNRSDFEVRVSVCLQTLASVAECLENLGFLVRVLGYHH